MRLSVDRARTHARLGLPGARTRRPALGSPRAARFASPLLLGILIGALGLAALRSDLIRIRYGLAGALREQQTLQEERRQLTAQLRELRDPTRLSRLAAQRGLARPEKLIELSSPRRGGGRSLRP